MVATNLNKLVKGVPLLGGSGLLIVWNPSLGAGTNPCEVGKDVLIKCWFRSGT